MSIYKQIRSCLIYTRYQTQHLNKSFLFLKICSLSYPLSQKGIEKNIYSSEYRDFRKVKMGAVAKLINQRERFYEQFISGKKKELGSSLTSHNLKGNILVYPLPAFENGEAALSGIHIAAEQLHVKVRLEGCTIFCSLT